MVLGLARAFSRGVLISDWAHAQAAAPAAAPAAPPAPTFNKGDNAWMLTSSVLVLMMTIPGLGLFYGGMVRQKNVVTRCDDEFYTVCIVTIIWVVFGYSLAFTAGSPHSEAFPRRSCMGVTLSDFAGGTSPIGATIHETSTSASS